MLRPIPPTSVTLPLGIGGTSRYGSKPVTAALSAGLSEVGWPRIVVVGVVGVVTPGDADVAVAADMLAADVGGSEGTPPLAVGVF